MKKGQSYYGFQTRTAGLQFAAPSVAVRTNITAAPANIPTADSIPSDETMDRIRARVAKESTSTHLTVVSDIFSTFGF